MKKTKKAYEEYLNSLAPDTESNVWWMGDKCRVTMNHKRNYGTMVRKHDPIAFEVGYKEWRRQ